MLSLNTAANYQGVVHSWLCMWRRRKCRNDWFCALLEKCPPLTRLRQNSTLTCFRGQFILSLSFVSTLWDFACSVSALWRGTLKTSGLFSLQERFHSSNCRNSQSSQMKQISNELWELVWNVYQSKYKITLFPAQQVFNVPRVCCCCCRCRQSLCVSQPQWRQRRHTAARRHRWGGPVFIYESVNISNVVMTFLLKVRCVCFQTRSSWRCRPCVTGWSGSCRISPVLSFQPRCKPTWSTRFKVRSCPPPPPSLLTLHLWTWGLFTVLSSCFQRSETRKTVPSCCGAWPAHRAAPPSTGWPCSAWSDTWPGCACTAPETSWAPEIWPRASARCCSDRQPGQWSSHLYAHQTHSTHTLYTLWLTDGRKCAELRAFNAVKTNLNR